MRSTRVSIDHLELAQSGDPDRTLAALASKIKKLTASGSSLAEVLQRAGTLALEITGAVSLCITLRNPSNGRVEEFQQEARVKKGSNAPRSIFSRNIVAGGITYGHLTIELAPSRFRLVSLLKFVDTLSQELAQLVHSANGASGSLRTSYAQ